MTAAPTTPGVLSESELSAPSRRRAPALLWALGAVVVLPAVVPVGLLIWTVVRPGGVTAGRIPVHRLAQLLGSTGVLVVAVTATTLILGVAVAWLISRTDLPGRRIWSTLVVLPLVIPSYVGALALLAASGRQGLISTLSMQLGLGPLPLLRGFWAAWGALSLWNFSFVYLLVAAAFRRMDPSLEEAARGLGSSRLRTFLTVVLPQLRPAMAAGSLLVSLYVLSDFGAVSLLRYQTFTRAVYTQFRGRLDPTPALFLSGVLVILALVLVIAERRTAGRGVLHAERPARPLPRIQLRGPARVAVLGFLTGLVAVALVVPAAVLGWWTVRGMAIGNPLGTMAAEAVRSVTVSGLAAVVTVAGAIPLAILTVRHRSRAARWMESTAWATYSLPHLAVGLAFLILAIRMVPLVYQRLPMLIIAYLAMFLPLALGAAQTGLRQVSPTLEEASRSLGRGGLATLTRVTLPLIGRPLLAGGALVFLTTMKELPATLLLRPPGFETLAVRIWSSASESLYTRASAASLLLLAVSAVPLYLLVSRELHD